MESFSAKVKKELSQLNNLNQKDLVKAELEGYLSTATSNTFSTQNEYNINRFSKLLTNIGEDNFQISIKGKTYTVKTKNKVEISNEIKTQEQIKSLVRGAFLGTGIITDPKRNYHLEILFDDQNNADLIANFLNQNEIETSMIKRKNKYVLYIENGESISNFLAFIGANKSVLEYEDLRVFKEVSNNVNRKVNCETANINKLIQSSVKQIDDIKYLKSVGEFENLSLKDKEIANLRLKNPNLSLEELGKLATPQLSKSGVSHRIANIQKRVKELKAKWKK